MTLSFQTKWGKEMGELAGMPTYFIAKIWNSLSDDILKADGGLEYCEYANLYLHQFDENWDDIPVLTLMKNGFRRDYKPHSIRQDPKNRWREGMDIHFVINNRTKNRFQFAPVIQCTGVQEIDVIYGHINELTKGFGLRIDSSTCVKVLIDRHIQTIDEIKLLAKNDGFNSVDDFFKFFNKDFKGRIIHWTNLKY